MIKHEEPIEVQSKSILQKFKDFPSNLTVPVNKNYQN